jgi:division protein CdvB (Snf7/Vps24/ESCRT-III family)
VKWQRKSWSAVENSLTPVLDEISNEKQSLIQNIGEARVKEEEYNELISATFPEVGFF